MIGLGKTAAVADQTALAKCVDCGQPVIERQCRKLVAITQEKGMRGDGESVNPPCN
jgi:hypothetical protein